MGIETVDVGCGCAFGFEDEEYMKAAREAPVAAEAAAMRARVVLDMAV